jgi:membrane protein
MKITDLWLLIKATVTAWIEDEVPSMGAALAYYTIFSLAPLLIIFIAIIGLIFGKDAAQGHLLTQLHELTGDTGVLIARGLLKATSNHSKNIIAVVVGVITLLIGATTVFVELQTALNRIWHVKPPKAGAIRRLILSRILSFGMVLGMGFLLLLSLLISMALSAIVAWWGTIIGGKGHLYQFINFVGSYVVITVVFAMIYKFLPHVKIGWRDVWTGAMVTSLLFTIGKSFLTVYLGKFGTASAFGAAGSLVVLLVWVYYSAQIFLMGAEFTWVYAHRFGSMKGKVDVCGGDSKS